MAQGEPDLDDERFPGRVWIIFLGLTASISVLIAIIGFFVVPADHQMPTHAGPTGFDNFGPRDGALTVMVFAPLLLALIFLVGYYVPNALARFVVVLTGTISMLIMLIYNIQALRYGMG